MMMGSGTDLLENLGVAQAMRKPAKGRYESINGASVGGCDDDDWWMEFGRKPTQRRRSRPSSEPLGSRVIRRRFGDLRPRQGVYSSNHCTTGTGGERACLADRNL